MLLLHLYSHPHQTQEALPQERPGLDVGINTNGSASSKGITIETNFIATTLANGGYVEVPPPNAPNPPALSSTTPVALPLRDNVIATSYKASISLPSVPAPVPLGNRGNGPKFQVRILATWGTRARAYMYICTHAYVCVGG